MWSLLVYFVCVEIITALIIEHAGSITPTIVWSAVFVRTCLCWTCFMIEYCKHDSAGRLRIAEERREQEYDNLEAVMVTEQARHSHQRARELEFQSEKQRESLTITVTDGDIAMHNPRAIRHAKSPKSDSAQPSRTRASSPVDHTAAPRSSVSVTPITGAIPLVTRSGHARIQGARSSLRSIAAINEMLDVDADIDADADIDGRTNTTSSITRALLVGAPITDV
jgi:hypothetical protein